MKESFVIPWMSFILKQKVADISLSRLTRAKKLREAKRRLLGILVHESILPFRHVSCLFHFSILRSKRRHAAVVAVAIIDAHRGLRFVAMSGVKENVTVKCHKRTPSQLALCVLRVVLDILPGKRF